MNWAVVLAGGDGTRLRPLTRELTGDNRPKQFCPLLGDRTLLAETLGRVAMNIAATRTLCVVTRDHDKYYRSELRHLDPRQVIEQPRNRGTAAAVAYGVARVARDDENAIVGFFPADHYYEDVTTFSSGVGMTYAAARAYPDRVFLLGTQPDSPEVEYGWIEPGARLEGVVGPIFNVVRFWEKPNVAAARELLGHGCLWNMFVMIGSVAAFQTLLQRAKPDLAATFDRIRRDPAGEFDIEASYDSLAPVDFSHDIVASQTHRVCVVRLPAVGWTDLGQPARVRQLMTRYTTPAVKIARVS